MSANRSTWTDDTDLDVALRDLGGLLDMPPAGDVAERVRARIDAERPRRAAVPWWLAIRGRSRRDPASRLRRSLVLAAAAVLLVAAAVTAAIGYGLPGIRILFGPPPSPTPIGATPGVPTPLGDPGLTLGLGTPLTLAEARALVDFPIALPPDPAIGPPDSVYLSGRRLALVWAPARSLPGTAIEGIGLLMIELRATVEEQMIRKLVDAGTTVEPITVDGEAGYWLAGENHRVAYVAPDGSIIDDSARVAGRTLLWTAGGVTYKLEGEFTRDEAIALAETLR